MPAPVVSLSPVSSGSASGNALGGASSAAVGSSLFGSFLSPNASISLLNIGTDTTTDAGPSDVALNDKSSFMLKGGTLMLFAQDGNVPSLESLKSLLDNMGNAAGELDTKILVALTPGTPSNDVLENIKSQLAELGFDASQVNVVMMQPSTNTLPAMPAITLPADAAVAVPALTIDTSAADNAQNILLVATGLNPSDMEAFKEAIKSALNGSTTSLGDNEEDGAQAATDKALTPADATDDAAMIALVVFVAPVQQVALPASAEDAAIDLSALSAFTQTPVDELAEPDWEKKLSDKLSTMTLPKGANDDVSPFDAEMNEILSYDIAPKEDGGFKGSLSLLNGDAKSSAADKASVKAVAGEMTAQAGQAMSHAAFTANAFAPVGDGSLLYTSGGLAAAQQTHANITNPVLTSASASSSHPSIHAVANLIEKSAGSEKAKQELSVQLDPPELGRMQIQLSTEKDGVMRVHLIAEKQDTVTMFQRDSHALKSALENAGIQLDNSSLTFDFAGGGQSFDQLMSGQDNSGGKTSRIAIAADGSILDTDNMQTMDSAMDFLTDKMTGNVHYSFLT